MIAFTLPGGIPVYASSLLLAAGVFIGLAGVALRAGEAQAARLVEAGMWALLAALIGARAAYVALAWPAFQAQPLQALQVHLGGLAWPGALAGGLAALPALARGMRRPVGALADALLPLLAALSVAAWLGCVPEGCGYGPPLAQGGPVLPDEWGALAPRWPLQAMCAGLCLAMFWLADRAPRRAAAVPGLRTALMLLGLAVVQLGAAALAVPERMWRGLPLDAWAALALGLLALAGLGWAILSVHGRGNE